MILLDTHVLVWLVEGSRRLGEGARARLQPGANELCLSAMTFWELSMLMSKGQISLTMPLTTLLDDVTKKMGMTVVSVTPLTAIDANNLPRLRGDPVDRLLIATARSLNCALLTADHVIEDYAKAGHLQAIDARR